MTTALVTQDRSFQISFTPEAFAQRDAALTKSALVARVENAEQNSVAVEAQAALHDIIRAAEAARVAAKEPVLKAGRAIDAAEKAFSAEAKQEQMRLAELIGNFATAEQARVRAAESLRLKELADIERKRQEELAKAETHEERDRINSKHDVIASETKPVEPARAERQVVRNRWEITVADVWALARAHPMCVKVEPRLREIEALLDAGMTVSGVTAKKVAVSGISSGRNQIVNV
jgi:hypothetical protein